MASWVGEHLLEVVRPVFSGRVVKYSECQAGAAALPAPPLSTPQPMHCSCLEGTESHVTFDVILEGGEWSCGDLDQAADPVPPYEDRLGPDG